MGILLKVTNWSENFENNRTKEIKNLQWVPTPNKHDGDGYTELLDHENGAAHFGAWNAIVQVASKCEPRGTLLRDGGRPHDSASLSRMTRIPEPVIREAAERLLVIGWLSSEVVSETEVTEVSPFVPQAAAVIPQVPALNGMEWNGMERTPPPTTSEVPVDESVDAAWEAVAAELSAAGMGDSRTACNAARAGGALPYEVRRELEYFQAHPGAWSMGLLYGVVKRMRDGGKVKWPEPAEGYVKVQKTVEQKKKVATQLEKRTEGSKLREKSKAEMAGVSLLSELKTLAKENEPCTTPSAKS